MFQLGERWAVKMVFGTTLFPMSQPYFLCIISFWGSNPDPWNLAIWMFPKIVVPGTPESSILIINHPFWVETPIYIIYIYISLDLHRPSDGLPLGLNINPTHGSYGSGSERPWKAKSARSCWPWNKPPPTCWGSRVFLQKLGVGRSFWNMTPLREGCKFVCFFLNLSVFFVLCTNRGNMLLCAWWPINLNYRPFEWS